jgi:tetratricopeptide (TPR) repeat protein
LGETRQSYGATRGITGPILFSSLETYKPVERIIDQIEQAYSRDLAKVGRNWLALSETQRREEMLALIELRPCLWIWDSVESVAGFPNASRSRWSKDEQRALYELLNEIGKTKAKVLLTSRRDEYEWLGGAVSRIQIQPMSIPDSLGLAKEICRKSGHNLEDIEDWRPLLKYAQGNPLTLLSVVGQVLQNRIHTKKQIDDYLAELRTGEVDLSGESEEGRSGSLFASLSYGFEHGFTIDEQKVLAVLSLFQGYVNVHVIEVMGKSPKAWHLEEIDRFSRAELTNILERAAQSGLLTSRGGGHYDIHPALPWFFRRLHEKYYRPVLSKTSAPAPARSELAFVEAMSHLGSYFTQIYEYGGRRVTGALSDEESNLLNGCRIALANDWWSGAAGAIQGLFVLYHHRARYSEWAHLLAEVTPHFGDILTGEPLRGRSRYWQVILDHHVRLSMEAKDWPEAERLARLMLQTDQSHAKRILKRKPHSTKARDKMTLRDFATSLGRVGDILRDRGNPSCLTFYEEAISLYRRIGYVSGEAARAFNMGHAYKNLDSIKNLDKAEVWYKKSIELRNDADTLARAQCLGQLGNVAYARAEEAPLAEKLPYVKTAAKYYRESLDLLHADAASDVSVLHGQLGVVYGLLAESHDQALEHWYKAIRSADAIGDVYRASGIRNNIAILLHGRGKHLDARDYIISALAALDREGIDAPELRSSMASLQRAIDDAIS